MQASAIEWTDVTWNPVSGCTEVSPGCDHCYARDLAERYRGSPAFPAGFDVTLKPKKLAEPAKWKRPSRVFVNSMSDAFHDAIPDDYVAAMWAAMNAAPDHQFQVLTKRPGRALHLASQLVWTPNIWLGVSVENDAYRTRIDVLRKVPAALRFLSCEPLIGPLDLTGRLDGISWVIDGGESGPSRRPADLDWYRAIRDVCADVGVAYLHKQGSHRFSGRDRLLDGRTHDGYPLPPPGHPRAHDMSAVGVWE